MQQLARCLASIGGRRLVAASSCSMPPQHAAAEAVQQQWQRVATAGPLLLQHHHLSHSWASRVGGRSSSLCCPNQQQLALQQQLHHSTAAAAAAAWRVHSTRGLQTAADRARARHKRSIADGGLYLGAVVLGMIGLSYVSVPLYRAFCQATGYGGTVSQTHNIEAKLKAREAAPNPELEAKAKQREIRVWFTSDVADDMPWTFTPTQDYVTVHPGESVLAFFTAHNTSPKAITGVSTYNVVPDQAAYYFNKVQCFCFEEQRLRGGEEVDMPVFFYLDPEIVTDMNCRNVHDITLSYTFFKVEDEDADLSRGEGGVRMHGSATLPPGVLPPVGGGVSFASVAGVAVAAPAGGVPATP